MTTTLERLWDEPPARALRWVPGTDLAALDCAGTPGWAGTKPEGEQLVASRAGELADLQERLFADGRSGGNRSVLLVLQGLDTAGKGGIVRHVVGLVDPQGVMHRSFAAPTAEEAAHGYLWRVREALPRPGYLGVFDRSHYEQVLVVRVEGLEPEALWRAHYDEILAFEQEVRGVGTTIVKVALMVSPEEQKARLAERLERRDKYWKYSPGDIDTVRRYPQYVGAYQEMLDRTSTEQSPWHLVPADRKWFARLAVTELLLGALRSLGLGWPPATFDVEAEKARLAAS
ncbi:polyphosphate kinase 2 family protein [Antribacter sp. KLBMP9083]|uniref:Polyphosphate kinase 2 family protein n=1 Tax=Antribacter soli TaxID=2910976 RepID=A0AA41UCB0_9MICO|nr:PPK2 family polyphosphate kinase [Antribacter soli]MCF4121904.1 polyphosphate kinase 2 family protein [Antribacter soli]